MAITGSRNVRSRMYEVFFFFFFFFFFFPLPGTRCSLYRKYFGDGTWESIRTLVSVGRTNSDRVLRITVMLLYKMFFWPVLKFGALINDIIRRFKGG